MSYHNTIPRRAPLPGLAWSHRAAPWSIPVSGGRLGEEFRSGPDQNPGGGNDRNSDFARLKKSGLPEAVLERTIERGNDVIDVPIEMTTSLSIHYLDFPSPVAGGFTDEDYLGGGTSSGGGVDYLVNRNNFWQLAQNYRAIQTDGYVLIDYDGDEHYDQAWYSEGGVWKTSTGGGRWSVDDGPMDELEELWERGFTL
jgi:hypothetical protein